MVAGVYAITCTVTGEQYVGGSGDVERRWKQHRYALQHDRHQNVRLQEAWRQHGPDAFTFAILEETHGRGKEFAGETHQREAYWLTQLRPVYNVLLNEHTEEQRQWRMEIGRAHV